LNDINLNKTGYNNTHMSMGRFRAKAKTRAFVKQRKITDFPSSLKKNLLAKSAILLWG